MIILVIQIDPIQRQNSYHLLSPQRISKLLFPPGNSTTIRLTSDWLRPAQIPLTIITPYMAKIDSVKPAATKEGRTATETAIKTRQIGTVGRNGTQCFLPQNISNREARNGT